MSNIISIKDFKISENKTFSNKSLFLYEALRRMKRKREFHEEEYEDVFCPFELMLYLNDVSKDFNNYRDNKNATK